MKGIFSRKRNICQIETYLDRLYGYACGLTLDKDSAADLVQTCALKALEAKKIPKDEAAYKSWIFKILRNSYYDSLRKIKANTISLDQTGQDGSPVGNKIKSQDVYNIEERLHNVMTIREAMKKLARDHHEVLALIDIVGFSYLETSKLLDVPIGTIMSRVSRARKVLLGLLSENDKLPAKKVIKLKIK